MSVPSPSNSTSDLELPQTIGRYEVLRLIGEGAMGRVLCAHDPVLGRDVAVKLLRGDLMVPRDVREGLLARMRHEARAAAKVAHPNMVTLHDMGDDPKLGLYLVFEYVEGPTLKQRLKSGPMPPLEAGRLARELGQALSFAHNEGILHRDIKPENVILSRTGGKIADFGIARLPDSTLTHAGGLMGTPAYSAPETFGGKNFSPASDQFSLAASLYEAIRGERAFPGDDAVEVAARIASDPPERFAAKNGLPAAVDDIFARAMAKAPVDRYPTCEEFGDALAEVLIPPSAVGRGSFASSPARGSIATVPESQLPTNNPPSERKRNEIILGAAAVVVTAALLVRTAMKSDDTTTPAPSPTTSASASADPPPQASEKPRSSATTPRIPKSAHPGPEPSASAAPSASEAPSAPPPTPDAPDAGARLDAGPSSSSTPASTSAPSTAPPAEPKPTTSIEPKPSP